jgi:cyclase
MKLEQVSEHCFAVLNENNLVCDANSGLINRGGGVVIDTQSDLAHAREMIDLFGGVWPSMAKRVVNTHEDLDHVFGNQLFDGAEIIGHRSLPERMREVADPAENQKLLRGVARLPSRLLLRALHPGVAAAGEQLLEDYDFDGVELVPPTTLFDERHELDLDGVSAHLIYVGPCHQVGDTIIHVPEERVIFAGDVLFRLCTPMGWVGSFEKWFQCLDLIISLEPAVVVPGHGPVCGIDGVKEMRAYLEYVRDESRKWFDDGASSLEAAKRIDLGAYADWKAPARLFMNVERAYREFRGEPADLPWDTAKTFDAVYKVAKAKKIPVEY